MVYIEAPVVHFAAYWQLSGALLEFEECTPDELFVAILLAIYGALGLLCSHKGF